jgi:hypothetical protein
MLNLTQTREAERQNIVNGEKVLVLSLPGESIVPRDVLTATFFTKHNSKSMHENHQRRHASTSTCPVLVSWPIMVWDHGTHHPDSADFPILRFEYVSRQVACAPHACRSKTASTARRRQRAAFAAFSSFQKLPTRRLVLRCSAALRAKFSLRTLESRATLVRLPAYFPFIPTY